jgi:hypothetical protein
MTRLFIAIALVLSLLFAATPAAGAPGDQPAPALDNPDNITWE